MELVVQDARSTDGTLEILESCGSKIELVSEEDAGPADAFWRAIKRCKGEIVGSCQSDEELLPDAVAWAVDFHEKHPQVGAVYGDVLAADKSGNTLYAMRGPDPFTLLDYLAARSTPNFAASFFKRKALEGIGLHTRRWALDCGEFELWSRLALVTEIQHARKCLAKYGIHGDSLSADPRNAAMLCRGRHRLIQQLYAENPDIFTGPDAKNDCILSTYLIFSRHLRAMGHRRPAVNLSVRGASRLLAEGAPKAAIQLCLKTMKDSIRTIIDRTEQLPQQALRQFWASLNAHDYETAYRVGTALSSTLSRLSSAIVSIPQYLLLYNYLKNCRPEERVDPLSGLDNAAILRLRSLFHENRMRHVAAFKDTQILFMSWLSQRCLDKDSVWGLLKHFGYHDVALFGGAPLGRALYRDLCESGFSVPAIVDTDFEGYSADFPDLPWKGIDFLDTGLEGIDLLLLTIEGPHDVQVQNQLLTTYKIRIPTLTWKDFVTLFYDRRELADFISAPIADASTP